MEQIFHVPTLLKLPQCLEIGTSREIQWAVTMKSVPKRLRHVPMQKPGKFELN